MRTCLLHTDEALLGQPEFLRAAEAVGARQVEARRAGAEVRLWGRDAALRGFADAVLPALRGAGGPRLTFMGSGDFHHLTGLLLEAALEEHDAPVTVIHFDNHPDWVRFAGGMHCGSWVNRALALPQVEKVITLGVCSNDLRFPAWKGAELTHLQRGRLELYPYARTGGRLQLSTIRGIGEDAFVEHLRTRITTPAVYLTVDKDVLCRDEALTNWDQGMMRLPYLLALIRAAAAGRRVIGADVTGDYARPHYTGSVGTRWAKYAEICLDQPWSAPDPVRAAAVNAAGNVALLEVLSEVMQ